MLDVALWLLTFAALGLSFWSRASDLAQGMVLSAFVIAFFARWQLDPEPSAWMRRNWWDLLLVLLLASPLARLLASLRAARIVPLLRLALFVRLGRRKLWALLLWSAESWPAAIAIGLAVVFFFGGLEFFIEHGKNPAFARFEDGLWWALATVTTVGYGDIAPITTAGRVVAALAMIFGIAAYSLLIANLTVQLERALTKRRRAEEGEE